MTGQIETLRSSVQAWQCDEIGHMNVQFYAAAATDAARSFAIQNGETTPIVVSDIHTRYHRELREADLFHTLTSCVGKEATGLRLATTLINSSTGDIAATFVTRTNMADRASISITDLLDDARPRGLQATSSLPALSLADADAHKLVSIHGGFVHPEQCDAHGNHRLRFLMGRFSEGAGHIWQEIGFDREELSRTERGAVVLEARLDQIKPIPAGTLLIGKSAIVAAEGRTLRFAHFLFDGASGELVTTSEVVAILFDLVARKSVQLTEEDHNRIRPYLRTFFQ